MPRSTGNSRGSPPSAPELGAQLAELEIYATACDQNGAVGYGPIEADFLYAFACTARPSRVVQIGAGVSTAVLLRAREACGAEIAITCIDPYPTEFLRAAAESGQIKLIAEPAETVPLEVLTDLGQGELLFVDSTHSIRPGSEVNRLVLEVLPRLRAGTLVHYHDIVFPYDHFPGLLTEELFFWSESTLLHAFLVDNPRFVIRAAFALIHNAAPERLRELIPTYAPIATEDGLIEAGRFWTATTTSLRGVARGDRLNGAPPSAARLRMARSILRRYPGVRGRWRLASTLLTGSPGDPHKLGQLIPPVLPDGEVIRCESGLLFRVRQDAMYLDPYLFGRYEPVLSRVVERFTQPGNIVFDLGANFGWFTNLLASRVGPTGSVFAFEPLPANAAIAAESIELNGCEEIVSLEVAGLGATEGSFTVYTFDQLPLGHASSSDLGRADARSHSCRLTTLDAYVAARGIDAIDLVKTDVDGHEIDVFTGGRETLGRPDAPVLHFEIAPEWLAGRGQTPEDVHDLLREYGYTEFWRIDPSRGISSSTARSPIETRIFSPPSRRTRIAFAGRCRGGFSQAADGDGRTKTPSTESSRPDSSSAKAGSTEKSSKPRSDR